MNLESIIEDLMAGDRQLTADELRFVIGCTVDEVAAAADSVDETPDYVLESALEQVAQGRGELADLAHRVSTYWLYVEHVPGGTIYEVAVRCAEFLALHHRKEGLSAQTLENWSTSDDWRQRLICAWAVRDDEQAHCIKIRSALANDAFQDDEGIYLVREGAGHYDD